MTLLTAAYIPWIAALGAIVCLVLVTKPKLKQLAGPVCVVSIAIGLVITLMSMGSLSGDDHAHDHPETAGHAQPHEDGHEDEHADDHHPTATTAQTVILSQWIYAGGDVDPDTGAYIGGVQIDFGYYFDGLTFIMLLVITGIGSLIAIYAMGYMKGDPGIARFFAAMALFIFAMTSLVMADNLVLLFLGWEGVGLCSYLLIGYYYDKPTAVAAAKKAFIVNRIGDFAFLIGIFLCYQVFGSLRFADIFAQAGAMAETASHHQSLEWTLAVKAIPYCLMVGAFGKSAQIPLFVWLPDAMAGPTPVSALVHAATMVTAGVYLIARMLPVFELVPSSLVVVAVVGAATALFAGTIALTSNDLKGVFAYSTVSQLGYMFLGLGALSTTGAVFHLVTHAFFKALLFLTAGSVMHALAGTLDIRTMGGLGKKMPVTKWLMFAGCLALAGLPPFAGFWSKDLILGDALAQGGTLFTVLAMVGLLTALLTAFYTFRLWFIVFTGETRFEMGDEHHSEDDHAGDHDDDHHAHEPHEMPWWPMNAPLVLLAIGSLAVGGWLHWNHLLHDTIAASSAAVHTGHGHGHGGEGMDPHTLMMILSIIAAVVGIALAYVFYVAKPGLPGCAAEKFAGTTATLRGKYFIDEFYDRTIVQPLNILGQVLYLIDQLVIHAGIMSIAWIPRALGLGARPAQNGKLQGYGLGMVAGVAAIALLMLFMMH